MKIWEREGSYTGKRNVTSAAYVSVPFNWYMYTNNGTYSHCITLMNGAHQCLLLNKKIKTLKMYGWPKSMQTRYRDDTTLKVNIQSPIPTFLHYSYTLV